MSLNYSSLFASALCLVLLSCSTSEKRQEAFRPHIVESTTQYDTIVTSDVKPKNFKSLKQQLWDFVDPCSKAIKDIEFEDNDYDSVLDDSNNGYLYISGSWPTCGCSCESTAGAYQNTDGSYILLKADQWGCSSAYRIVSNGDLTDIMPDGFGLSTFMEHASSKAVPIKNGFFYLDIDIPRKGTQTKFQIRPVPFGLNSKCEGGLCYSIEENSENSKYLGDIQEIISKLSSEKSLMLLMDGNYEALDPYDKTALSSVVDIKEEESFNTLISDLKLLFDCYILYQKLEYTKITAEWSRELGRFIIKQKFRATEKISFLDFLKNGRYYSPAC